MGRANLVGSYLVYFSLWTLWTLWTGQGGRGTGGAPPYCCTAGARPQPGLGLLGKLSLRVTPPGAFTLPVHSTSCPGLGLRMTEGPEDGGCQGRAVSVDKRTENRGGNMAAVGHRGGEQPDAQGGGTSSTAVVPRVMVRIVGTARAERSTPRRGKGPLWPRREQTRDKHGTSSSKGEGYLHGIDRGHWE